MPKLPTLTGTQLIRVLENIGFVRVRQKGSHVQLRRTEPDGQATTFPVPVHTGRSLKPGTLKGILRKANLDVEQLLKLL